MSKEEYKTKSEAAELGYATFNRGPHLCLDIPDGQFTISTRTSNGKCVTFAFVPYAEGAAPAGCIDIQQVGDAQRPIIFGQGSGRDPYHYKRDVEGRSVPKLVTLVLGETHEDEVVVKSVDAGAPQGDSAMLTLRREGSPILLKDGESRLATITEYGVTKQRHVVNRGGELVPQEYVAEYTQDVNFSSVDNYGTGPEYEDDVYTVERFKTCCATNAFVDYDGHGHPVKDGKYDPAIEIKPSRIQDLPRDATHVMWHKR